MNISELEKIKKLPYHFGDGKKSDCILKIVVEGKNKLINKVYDRLLIELQDDLKARVVDQIFDNAEVKMIIKIDELRKSEET